jgi:hypothetical protein
VSERYAERLLRLDLAAHVGRALDRGDPRIGLLFDAIRGFVTDLPPGHAAASTALARGIVEPPLRRWHRVAPEGRPAYWQLFQAALQVDPALPAKGTGPLGRLGLRLARTRPAPGTLRLATGLLWLARVADVVTRRIPWAAGFRTETSS